MTKLSTTKFLKMPMVTLSLANTKAVILAAWNHWLDNKDKSFDVKVGGYDIKVVVELRQGSLDCGMPGYNMDNGDVSALKDWVPKNIVHPKTGGCGVLLPCKNVGPVGQVNVLYRAATNFNFHVNLVKPCS